ncbi:MAG: ABC transporter substrate-binding protein [Betaproteobacteria bacterium]
MSRRKFLQQSTALGAATLLGIPRTGHAEPPPEVRKIRLAHFPAICLAPGYLAEDLLRAEGFDEVEYVDLTVNTTSPAVGSGRVDMWMDAAPSLVNLLASADSAVALGGIHSGCYELVAKTDVKSIRALKERSVSVSVLGSTEHIFVAGIVSYVGLDPHKDIEWKVAGSSDEAMKLFADGGSDAILGFAPQPQELRAKKIGHVILNTTHDRPWSQYFCCMITGNREFVRKNPVATKRAMRAFLKGADICATQPARAARFMADKGYAASYDAALEVIGDLPYRRWRDASPEDTIRFHALRLYEAGIIKASPEKLIEKGTDWRFFNELKKELKA